MEACHNKNWTLLEYNGTGKKAAVKCNNNHITNAFPINIIKSKLCFICTKETHASLEQALFIAAKKGGTIEKIDNRNCLCCCKNKHHFKKNIYNVVIKNEWCPLCNSKWKSEEICRELFETIFDKPFPKYRADWLKNKSGKSLELDGYCEDLGLAFEHNGPQHYENIFKIKNYSITKENDNEKYTLCDNKNIKLIIIPQLLKVTKINNICSYIIDEFKRLKIIGYDKIYKINMDNVLISVANRLDRSEEYINKANQYAKNKGGCCISENCLLITDFLKWKCNRGHFWESTYINTVVNEQWCQNCCQRKYWLEKDYLIDLVNKKLSLSKISDITNIPRKNIYDLTKHHNIKLFKSKLNNLSRRY